MHATTRVQATHQKLAMIAEPNCFLIYFFHFVKYRIVSKFSKISGLGCVGGSSLPLPDHGVIFGLGDRLFWQLHNCKINKTQTSY
jgi:hypothetical protein